MTLCIQCIWQDYCNVYILFVLIKGWSMFETLMAFNRFNSTHNVVSLCLVCGNVFNPFMHNVSK